MSKFELLQTQNIYLKRSVESVLCKNYFALKPGANIFSWGKVLNIFKYKISVGEYETGGDNPKIRDTPQSDNGNK